MTDNGRLQQLAAAVLAGTAVDWDAEESRAVEADRAAIRELRVLSRVADLGRHACGNVPPHDGIPPHGPQPTSWGHLSVGERVGEGAFGAVYRAWDTRLEREVALKLFPPDLPNGAPSATLREARLLARVRHPNVVTVYGADEFDGRVGLWTELVPGRTLDEALRQDGPYTAGRAASIGMDVCRALGAVHQAGLLHRDIKAQNVMCEQGGRVVLMDFGMVRSEGDAPDAGEGTGGTPLYMAPELFEHRPPTVASDIYAVGVLLYRLVTGSYPVSGRTVAELRAAHAAGQRRALCEARPDLPAAFARAVDQALERDPNTRWASVDEMESALAHALTATAGAAPTDAAAVWQPAWWGIAAGSLALVVLFGLFVAWPARSPLTTGLPPAAALPERKKPTTLQPPRSEPTRAATTQPVRLSTSPASAPVVPSSRRGWILVGVFENRSGKSSLDGEMEAGMERELSHSELVRLVPPQRVQDALRLMKRPPEQPLTPAVALELSRRDNEIDAVITGRLGRVGSRFQLEARVLDVRSGSTVATISRESASEDDLFAAIRLLSADVRQALGESRDRIRATDDQLEHVTTPSLEALRLYSASRRAAANYNYGAALPLARGAASVDPAFASAHAWVAYLHIARQDGKADEEAVAAADRASALINLVSGPERLFIEAVCHEAAGRTGEATAAYEAYLRVRPDDVWAIERVLVPYLKEQRGNDAARAYMQAATLRPNDYTTNYWAAWYGLVYGSRLREIQPFLARARALLSPDLNPSQTAWVRLEPAFEDWLRNDARKGAKKLDEAARLEDTDPAILTTLAGLDAAFGRLRAAEAVLDRFVGEPLQNQWSLRAEMALMRGDVRGAQTAIREVLRSPVGGGTYAANRAAALMVRARMVDEAASMLANLPNDRQKSLDFPLAEGEVALARGEVEAAIQKLAGWNKIVHGMPTWVVGATSYAEALERHGDLLEAARVLEELSNERLRMYVRPVMGLPWFLRSRVQLARIYRSMGRTKDAAAVDSELRRLLACADPDLAVAAGRH